MVGVILGRMEKRERKWVGKVYGWEGEGGENWWGLAVFPSGLPKLNLPKLGENENENEE